MSKHTPGPWVARPYAKGIEGNDLMPSIFGPDGRSIASCGNAKMRSFETRDANARLIAAAPEMYAALKKIVGKGMHVTHDCARKCVCGFLDAKAAIAKAEGGGE